MADIPTRLTDILSTAPEPAYCVMFLAKNRDDEQGRERARMMVDSHAVEMWDGLRFIEYFPPHH